jgi:hypothetical protein
LLQCQGVGNRFCFYFASFVLIQCVSFVPSFPLLLLLLRLFLSALSKKNQTRRKKKKMMMVVLVMVMNLDSYLFLRLCRRAEME